MVSFIPTLYLVTLFLRKVDWNRVTDRKHAFYRMRIFSVMFGLFIWTAILLLFNITDSSMTFVFQSLGIFIAGFLGTFGIFYRKVKSFQEEKMFLFIEKFEESFGNSKVEQYYAGFKSVYGPDSFTFRWKYRGEEIESPSILKVKDYIEWFKEERERSINDDLVSFTGVLPKTLTLDKVFQEALQEEIRELTGNYWILKFDFKAHAVSGEIGTKLAKQGTDETTYPTDFNHIENIFLHPLLRLEGIKGLMSWDPRKVSHLKIIGSTGFGKSIALKAMIYHQAVVNGFFKNQNMPPFYQTTIIDIVKGATSYYPFEGMHGITILGGSPNKQSLLKMLETLEGIEERRQVKQDLIGELVKSGVKVDDAVREVHNRHGVEVVIIDEYSGAVAKTKDKALDKLRDQITNKLNLLSATGREVATHIIIASQEISRETFPTWMKNNFPISLVGWLSFSSSVIAVGDGSANDLPVTDITNEDSDSVHGAGLFGQAGMLRRSQTIYLPEERIWELRTLQGLGVGKEQIESSDTILKFNTDFNLKFKGE